MEKQPTWLRAMQNGTIGEARAKSFLIDRFWILERSVDIDGADFIIQRRITRQNILDRTPPRFGVVQVKFFSSEQTTHYLPVEYVLDENGEARDEFFLLCFTGVEDSSKMFFLTAKNIKENFFVSEIKNNKKYRLYGKQVFNERYKVHNKKLTLDRIESQLVHADFTKNREFISWKLPSAQIDTSAILPEFKEPLHNWWGDIPEGFRKMKDTVYQDIMEIEEVHDKLTSIIEETDPLKALEVADEIRTKYGSAIKLSDDLYDDDFERVCFDHRKRLEALEEDGLLDAFLAVRENMAKEVVPFLHNNLPFDSNTVHSIFIDFDHSDFSINSIRQELTRANEYWNISDKLNQFGHMEIPNNRYNGIKDISESKFEFYWLPGRIYIEDKYKNDLKGFYSQTHFSLYNTCMDKMYYTKY